MVWAGSDGNLVEEITLLKVFYNNKISSFQLLTLQKSQCHRNSGLPWIDLSTQRDHLQEDPTCPGSLLDLDFGLDLIGQENKCKVFVVID